MDDVPPSNPFSAPAPSAIVAVHLKVDGMMCQKNCGSTVRAALLNADLSDVRRFLLDAASSRAGGREVVVAAAVVDAEADFETSYARATVEWDARVREDLISMDSASEGEGEYDGDGEGDEATAGGILKLDSDDIKKGVAERVAEIAVDEVECVGFDAVWLVTDADASAHRRRARDEREAAGTKRGSPPPADASASIDRFEDDDPRGGGGGPGGGATATLHVTGMSCAVCTGSVERSLLSVGNGAEDDLAGPRVIRAAVSLPTNTARVAFSSPAGGPDAREIYKGLAEECAATVTKGGYACQVLDVRLAGETSSSNEGDGGGTTLVDSAARMERTRQEELKEWKYSLVASLAFTLPLAVIHFATMPSSKGGYDPDPDAPLPPSLADWTMLVLATPVQFGVGRRFYVGAYRGLVHGCTMGMDFLVVLGTTCAYLYSVIVFVMQVVAKANGDVQSNAVAKLRPTFETGAWLITFVTLGKFLEAYARGKTAGALQTLMELQPVSASKAALPEEVLERLRDKDERLDGEEEKEFIAAAFSNVNLNSIPTEEKDISEVRIGDYLLVLPGGRIPTDGILVAREGSGQISTRSDSADSLESASKGGRGGGCAYVDESAFSGEPFPVAKRPGDAVYGASVNQLSVILVEVTATGSETALSRIVRLVDEAQGNRAPIQAQADRIASIFAPCVMMLSLLTFAGWVLLLDESWGTREERYVTALMSAISVVVVACPCALGLATPTAVMVGTGVGAVNGLLVKGGAVLEMAKHVTTVVFDKTGTLTTGRAVVGSRIGYINELLGDRVADEPLKMTLQSLPSPVKQNDIALWLACCAEVRSDHPLGSAILNAGKKIWGHDILKPTLKGTVDRKSKEENDEDGSLSISEFRVVPGRGVQCHIDGIGQQNDDSCIVRVGNRTWAYGLEDNEGISSLVFKGKDANKRADEDILSLRNQGQIGVYVSAKHAKEGDGSEEFQVVGVIGIIDPIKHEAKSTVAALKHMDVDVWMCTGDHEVTAQAVARNVGIDESNVCSNVTPEGKADLIRRLQKRRVQKGLRSGKLVSNRVAVVGDGINDAVALARSDVGIAIGAGTEVAIEAADIVLVRSQLHDVVVSLHLSRVVFDRIRLNFVWAMAYNLFALPFAAGLLYPFTDWTLPPAFAGLMMAFSSVTVVASSLLLRAYVKPVINDDGHLEERGCARCSCGFIEFCYSCLFQNPLRLFQGDQNQWYGYPLENELEISEQSSIV
ncbi:hypothetical protein ACHAWF_009659 [Thalassiosira exigua]